MVGDELKQKSDFGIPTNAYLSRLSVRVFALTKYSNRLGIS